MMLQPTERMIELHEQLDKAKTKEEIDRIGELIKEERKNDPRVIKFRKLGFAV